MKMKNEKGFSLVELLVVVIIIAIVAAIAIPNLLASRRSANEASAVSSLRTIHSAQATYQATQGNNVNYGTLAQLAAVNSPDTSGLIDTALGAGSKSGYNFTVAASTAQIYCAEAHPTTVGTTGNRSFAVSQPGVIYASPNDSIDCDAATGVITGDSTSPIQ
jgi:prepilin-type N-terminal cleavage/methylation domain-containing protein